MIHEQKRFVITSDIIYIHDAVKEHETLEEAERMQTIITLAEFIHTNTDGELSGFQYISLAEALLFKFDKI